MIDEENLPPVLSLSSWNGNGGSVTIPRRGQDLPNFLRIDLVRAVALEARRFALIEAMGVTVDTGRSHPSSQGAAPVTQIEMTLRRRISRDADEKFTAAIEDAIAAHAYSG